MWLLGKTIYQEFMLEVEGTYFGFVIINKVNFDIVIEDSSNVKLHLYLAQRSKI